MSRWSRILLVLAALLAAVSSSLAAGTVKLPPPDLRGLVPLAALPLDKPAVPLPAVAPTPPPVALPDLPPLRAGTDPRQRPTPALPPPRTLACNPIGTVLGVASELLECGRARYQRNELEEARDAFQKAIQQSSDRGLLREARYWQAETLLRLGRAPEVERILQLVVQDDPRSEFGLYAADELGWVSLELGDPRRALGYFDGLLKLGPPPGLATYARHGRAMALYGLKRYAEARDEWAGLLNLGGFSRPSAPAAVVAESNLWLGDTLGRLGDYKGAVPRLQAAVASGASRPIVDGALLRLGWWSRLAGDAPEAVKAYRRLLASNPSGNDALWARAGLVQALLDTGDYTGAREEAVKLEAADRSRTFSLATWLIV
ncbi:MAG TPA: tetratricopeptide repeat protein, partial [Candidatus Methylomirabilis sp.]|nr:tetratricopeptide repeat protein [Candidatus Methylomirabilis sp.]